MVCSVILKCSEKLSRNWMPGGSGDIINSMVKTDLWAWSFQVALWTLGQLVASTGYVVEPYRKYPTLLEVLLNFLKTEQNQGTRREVWAWSCRTTISKSFLGRESHFSSGSSFFNPWELSKHVDSYVDFYLAGEVLISFLSVLPGYSCVRVAGCFGPLQTQSEHWNDWSISRCFSRQPFGVQIQPGFL